MDVEARRTVDGEVSCRLCGGSRLTVVLDAGDQPIAHRLLESPNDPEIVHRLALHHCAACGLIQICAPIDPAMLYLDYNYCFSSWKPQPHMLDEIEMTLAHTRPRFAFEVGCNDGTFLDVLRQNGVSTLAGVEPNRFAGGKGERKGLRIYPGMLSDSVCRQAVAECGRFDLVVARQVLEHIADIEGFFRCIDELASVDGFLLLETPDVEAGVTMGDCSVVWEEHVNYFTEPVIRFGLRRFGYEPVALRRYNFSGGALAILARRARRVGGRPGGSPLGTVAGTFKQKVDGYGDLLRRKLGEWRERGGGVVLYGVGCRACTVTNALGLGKYLDFAVDDRIERQGKYLPGARLPIRSPETLRDGPRPLLCLLAVNQENEARVKSRLNALIPGEGRSVSLCSPADIWGELEALQC